MLLKNGALKIVKFHERFMLMIQDSMAICKCIALKAFVTELQH